MISALPTQEWEQPCRDILEDLNTELAEVEREFKEEPPDKEDYRSTLCAILFVRAAVEDALRAPLTLHDEDDVLGAMLEYTEQANAELLIHIFWRQTFPLHEDTLPLSEKVCCTIVRTSRHSIRKFFDLEDEDKEFEEKREAEVEDACSDDDPSDDDIDF